MASWQLRTVSFGECNIWKYMEWNITWNEEFSFIIPTGWLNFLPSSVKNRNDENCWLWTLAFKGVPSTTRIFHKIVTLLHVNESKVSPKALAIYDPLSPPAIFFQSAAKATPQQVPWHPCTCPGRSLASPRKSMRQRWFPNTRPLQLQKIMHHPCTFQTEHWGLFITKEHGHNVEPKAWQVLQTQHINHNQAG